MIHTHLWVFLISSFFSFPLKTEQKEEEKKKESGASKVA